MGGTKYANAVAAVRAMENTLLSRSDIDQLIDASTSAEIESLLSAKRGTGSGEFSLESVWEIISGYAPDSEELKILLYRNDFHNIKAALKTMIAGREPEPYYIRPTNISLDTLGKLIAAKDFGELPPHVAKTAAEAYELITRTLDGQLADSFIDCAALSAMQKAAERSGSELMDRFAQLITVCADIKTAYRCAIMKKQRSFLETAVCGSRELDKDSLVRASLGGTESVLSFLENTSFSEAGKLLAQSPAAFEKWCDDVLIELAQTARYQAFGSDPLAAYYLAAEAELKNLRIIKVCRECGTDRQTITERMRKLYV